MAQRVSGKVDNPTFHSESRMSSDVARVTLRSDTEDPYSTNSPYCRKAVSLSSPCLAPGLRVTTTCVYRGKSRPHLRGPACQFRWLESTRRRVSSVQPAPANLLECRYYRTLFFNCRWMRLMVAWYSDALKRHSHVHDVSRFRISSRKKACSGCAR